MAKKMVLCLIAGLILVATIATAQTTTAKYKEPPMLAERVRAGQLPPVDQRLPEKPVVVKVEEKLGTYGGTLRMGVANRQNAINSALEGRFTDQAPFTFDKFGSVLQPNWLESGTISADGRTYTVVLRKGLKWSDGVALNSDDLMFTFVDMAQDTDLNPKGVPSWLKDVKVEKVDTWTVRFNLPRPTPLFAYTFQDSVNVRPLHYMKQFFIKYAKKEDLEAMAKDAGFASWFELFQMKLQNDNPDKPVLSMWKLVAATAEKVVCERNPYFWKVDENGNQLPYIDRFEMSILAAADTIALKAMAGEFDLAFYSLKFSDFPTYKSNEKQGNYTVYVWKNAQGASHLKFNQNFATDAEMGKLLRNPEFKKALSIAINRNEVNQLVFLGQGNAVAMSPAVGDPAYSVANTQMYAAYDPAKAKSMLDAIGVKDVNGDGKRELPNGAKLQLEVNLDVAVPDYVSTCELVKGYWDAVGIATNLNSMSFERRSELDKAGTYMVSVNKIDNILYPMYFASMLARFANGSDTLAVQWEGYLNTDGKQGEKPSVPYQAMYDTWKKVTSTTSDTERAAQTKLLWDNYYANLWAIGVIQEVPYVMIVSNKLKNVPKEAMNAWPLRTPCNANLAQFFFQK